MEAFLVSVTTVGIAEIGDRTQLLSLLLAARYRRPWPITAGILCATLAALWTLKPDKLEENAGPASAMGAFLATLSSFFIAEIGDKTQIATLALAAAYPNLLAVVAGTTAGIADG